MPPEPTTMLVVERLVVTNTLVSEFRGVGSRLTVISAKLSLVSMHPLFRRCAGLR